MNLKKAQKLIQTNIASLTAEQLQKYKVSLLDAWRYAKSDYGYNNDFFVYLPEMKAFIPADKWLLKNINTRLDEVLNK